MISEIRVGDYTLRRIEASLQGGPPGYRPIARIQIVHKGGFVDYDEEVVAAALHWLLPELPI
jgi:hypothetical protein